MAIVVATGSSGLQFFFCLLIFDALWSSDLQLLSCITAATNHNVSRAHQEDRWARAAQLWLVHVCLAFWPLDYRAGFIDPQHARQRAGRLHLPADRRDQRCMHAGMAYRVSALPARC
jgi:hypothetical protein